MRIRKLRPAFAGALLIAGVLSLTGCQTSDAVGKGVAAAEIALTDAARAMLIYERLPRCGDTVVICSSQVTVDKLKVLLKQANTVVTAAETNSALITDAWIAISALSLAIPK